jgi:tetratricopeptide (TPR) repeat protein
MSATTPQRFPALFSWAALWVLVGSSLTALIIGGYFWVRSTGVPLTGNLQDAKDLIGLYEKHADSLEKLLSFLLALTALYGIALGLNAYQQAKESAEKTKQIMDQAERSVGEMRIRLDAMRQEAKQEVNDFLMKMHSTFPVFGDMDNSIRNIMFRVMRLLPILDWSEESFKRLTEQEKQEILFYEKTVASFEYFELGPMRQTASEIYHGLGNFYGLKFLTGGRSPDDWQRAAFYLERAIKQDGHNIGALNDRGMLELSYDESRKEVKFDLERAKEYFERSRLINGNQQRALYNLAWLLSAKKDYQGAADILTEALTKDRWQGKPNSSRRKNVLYNRACAWCRLAELESHEKKRAERLEHVWSDLEEAFRGQIQPELIEALKEDLQPGNDLHLLISDNKYSAKVDQLIQTLT